MHRASLPFGRHHRDRSTDSGSAVEVRVHQCVKLTIGFADADLDPRDVGARIIDSCNLEASNLGNNPTVIVDWSRTGFAQDRSKVPHVGAQDRRRSDGLRLDSDEFDAVDGNNVDLECINVADAAGERSSVACLRHEVEMLNIGAQRPDEGWTCHPLVAGIEHTVASPRSVRRRDKTPGNTEGIVNDQFRAEMASNERFELGSDELTSLLQAELIAQGSALLCVGGFGCLGALISLLATTEATLEALDTTSGIDDLHLTSEEGMAR